MQSWYFPPVNNQSLNILHVIPSVSPLRGGPSYAVINMVKALRKQGINAEIATTDDNGATGQPLDVPLGKRTDYQGVPIYFFPAGSSSGASLTQDRGFLFSWPLTQWLWKHIQDYDLIHTHYLFSYASTCAAVIAKYHKTPYIRRTIGQLSPWALAQSRGKKQLYSLLIERHNLNQAAAIHCTSDGEALDVRNYGITAPTVTISLGVEIPEIQPDAKAELRKKYDIPLDAPIILFLSRLHYKKRPDLLIEALHQVKSKHPNIYLLLAGSGDPEYIQELNQLLHQLDLQKCTRFTGFVTGKDKDLVLQGSDIFVLPSFSENFGIAVVEALAAGLPAIVTPEVQIAPEIEQANAGLVVEGNRESVASAITQLLDSDNQQLDQKGQTLVKHCYSWPAIAEKLADIYLRLIQKNIRLSN
ncbi:glycosyltransferase [Roseofilum reptotaenium CS-1145]|uniref:Group 1 glycosyl transferase n=1 Tax=Roseofilum reptotaenium AO1-A TaxID=1925591 RepID=A0A1L9QS32_9CYAN|nr:glycosyltransferase [Roseofilum reptotaenium]MDB9518301.1 glycosyltransferase [Roseofilum reptotaenium CS-1145]OJJ25500.1 group 1 glycosyl transferase [Roseofilum reptotaenium AO1-A]